MFALEWLVLYLDTVRTPPPLPAAVQVTPPLSAPVQVPPLSSAPVQAPPPSSAPSQAPPPLPAPVRTPPHFQMKSKKEDDEDKLSDVEKEGYCDDKNPPDIITKLRTVKGQRMKDLFDNTDQVLFTLSTLVSLFEVFVPPFY